MVRGTLSGELFVEARDLLVGRLELLPLGDLCPKELVVEGLELELTGVTSSLRSHCSTHDGMRMRRRPRRRNIVANLLLVLGLILRGVEPARELCDVDFIWWSCAIDGKSDTCTTFSQSLVPPCAQKIIHKKSMERPTTATLETVKEGLPLQQRR